jgi:hypothetical protein
MSTTIRVKGIYNGETVQPVTPLAIPPDTEVEILIPEQMVKQADKLYQLHQELLKAGIITGVPMQKPSYDDFEPVGVTDKPVSEIIIEERR